MLPYPLQETGKSLFSTLGLLCGLDFPQSKSHSHRPGTGSTLAPALHQTCLTCTPLIPSRRYLLSAHVQVQDRLGSCIEVLLLQEGTGLFGKCRRSRRNQHFEHQALPCLAGAPDGEIANSNRHVFGLKSLDWKPFVRRTKAVEFVVTLPFALSFDSIDLLRGGSGDNFVSTQRYHAS